MKALVATGQPEAMVAMAETAMPLPRPGDEAMVKEEAFSVDRGESFLLQDPDPRPRPGKDIAGLGVQGYSAALRL